MALPAGDPFALPTRGSHRACREALYLLASRVGLNAEHPPPPARPPGMSADRASRGPASASLISALHGSSRGDREGHYDFYAAAKRLGRCC